MPRKRRFLLSESYYHIMTRGNNRNTVFRCEEDYLYFKKLICKYKQEHPFDLYHYCLMPNHTHFLIQTKLALDFSTFMKKLNLAYFHHYRQSYGWVGHFWQDRYKSQAVGKDSYFVQCGKYIELNPIRKGIVKLPEDYPFSSYGYYANGLNDALITPDFMYEHLGNNQEECQSNYSKLIVASVIEESYKKFAWGSDYQRYKEKEKVIKKTKRSGPFR